MLRKTLFAAVAASTLAIGFAPTAQAFHDHYGPRVVCHYHMGHRHCRIVGHYHHYHHYGHHHHGHHHGHHHHGHHHHHRH